MTSCRPRRNSFRLLDCWTGWDVDEHEGVVGFQDRSGLRLAPRLGSPRAVHLADLRHCLLPARLAWDPAGRLFAAAGNDLRVLDPCTGRWRDLVLPFEPVSISGLSWGGGLLAVADRGGRRVHLLRGTEPREVLRIDLDGLVDGRPRLVGLTPWGLVAVVTEDPPGLLLCGLDGLVRAWRPFPEARRAAELGMVCVEGEDGPRGELLLAVRLERGWRRLLLVDRHTLATSTVEPSQLRCRPPAGLDLEIGEDETWRLAGGDDPPVPVPRRYAERGRVLTLALDSEVDGCQWHRIRVDADRPEGTDVKLRLATLTEDAGHPGDRWQTLPQGASEALIRQDAGRYLRVELELVSDGQATPVVRAVRADFDVDTSLDRLPEVYWSSQYHNGEEGEKEVDFLRRFLSLFDASFQDLDEVIIQAPLLFEASGLPDHVLPALAAKLGVPADPSWPPDRLRALLAAWPQVSPLLGTAEGLRRLVAAVYQVKVQVEELGAQRPWGATGQARLGQVRLFGAGRASLRLGTGRLGESLVEPFADPLAPAYGSGAFLVVVHVPAGLARSSRPGLEALVRAFLPAHLAVRVRHAPAAVTVGGPLSVGVGTRLGGPLAGVLGGDGEHALVLARQGPLAAAAGGAPVTVGRRSIAGITTTVR
jgi:phage tail-like protein